MTAYAAASHHSNTVDHPILAVRSSVLFRAAAPQLGEVRRHAAGNGSLALIL
jgi:hypothetical protein